METVHAGSPTKHPAARLATIEAAGELRIPFTSGILVGIGETEEERMASLEALAEVQSRHGHIQEVILQNFVPHPRYHGQEVGEIADRAAQERWSRERRGRDARRAAARVGEPDHDRGPEAARAPLPLADAGRRHPDSPEPVGLVDRAGARGRDRPRRAVRQRRPHLARASVPEPAPGAQAPEAGGLCAHRAAVRVSAVHRAGLDRPGRARHDQVALLVVHPAPRLRTQQRRRGRRRACAGRDREGARRARAEPCRADSAVRRAPARGDRGHAARSRRAARAARRRHRHVRRQPQHQLHERVPGGLCVLRVRSGPPLAGRIPRDGGRLRRRRCARRSTSG